MTEKLTISFEDFVKYYIKRWKTAAAIVILCAAIFAVGSRFLGEEIVSAPSEEYLYYEQESAWLERYLKESILMQINPTEIPERTLYLKNISVKEETKDYVMSRTIWENYITDRNTDYFYELLDWQEEEDSGNVQLTIRHVTEEECLDAAEYLKNCLEKEDVFMEVTIGESQMTKDEELQDEQLRWYDRIDYSKTLLLDSQAGFTIQVNTMVSTLTGVAAGGILSIVLIFILCLKERNQKTES